MVYHTSIVSVYGLDETHCYAGWDPTESIQLRDAASWRPYKIDLAPVINAPVRSQSLGLAFDCEGRFLSIRQLLFVA